MTKEIHIPIEVNKILRVLRKANYEAYLVGGCVRDVLRGTIHGEFVEPKDWDITTSAKPDEVQKLFSSFAKALADRSADKPATVYENTFGTVGIKTESENPSLKIVEVTTFRKEGKYTDKRHPDSITFAKTVEEDLSRRDFTINSLALGWSQTTTDVIVDGLSTENETKISLKNLQLVDPYSGQADIKAKLIKTVGKPEERFTEDALRMMRAIRLASELGFKIDGETGAAILHHSGLLEAIAKERIRDEFQKIIISSRAKDGVQMLEDYGLLRHVMPELREGIDIGQNKHHIYSVWEHNLRALDYSVSKNYSLHVRLASLLHDVGKPKSKRGDGPDSTFYGHDMIGGKMTVKIMDRLHFSKDLIEQVAHLVRYHLFYYNVDEVTPAGVRRFLVRVGSENIDDLIKVREADRIGSGVPKAVPYKLRHLLFMIEKVKRDPISPKMLLVKGDDLIKILDIPPGPKIGAILNILLEDVIEDPKRNIREYLEKRIKELGLLSDKELHQLAKKAKESKNEFEKGAEDEIKKRHYVK